MLRLADLRAADLMSPDACSDKDASDLVTVERGQAAPIDGLKLTIFGDELQRLLDERIRSHMRREARWKREPTRTPEEQTEDEPLLPEHMCENEAERHEWRAEMLEFIRDHVEPAETYRLGEADLVFGELLPAKPGWLEQEEYEERTSVRFNLERLVKRVDGVGSVEYALLERHPDDPHA